MSDFANKYTVYIIRMSFSASKIVVTVVVPRVCVCLFIVFAADPNRTEIPVPATGNDAALRTEHASRTRNIGKLRYVFTEARKNILYIIIVILFDENASFRSYGDICLPRMPLTTPEPQNTDTNGIHATWA